MEIIANAVQTVLSGGNVLFTNTPVEGCANIRHREGSGLVTLRGATDQCRARYRVAFTGNIAVPTTGVAGPIQLTLTIDGEPVNSTTMIVTPTATGAYFNVSADIFIDVPKGCCMTIAIRNTTTTSVNVQNANLIAVRVA